MLCARRESSPANGVRWLGCALVLFCCTAAAQPSYPAKPLRWVVPFAPGGGGDIVIRAVGQRLSESLGQPVLIENRSGAGGNVGTDAVAKAAPDGYTILMANVAPMAINVTLYGKLPYDPVRDFAPITLLATFPNVLVLHPSVPAKTVTQLTALARAKPGQLSYASAGNGSTTHLAAELFATMAKLDMVHVPYKGGGPALADLLGGHVSLYFGSLPAALPHMRTARVRALAITSASRSRATPELPTMAESGFPGYEADTWIGAVAPAGTPSPVVSRLNNELVRILANADMQQFLLNNGAEPVTNTPDQFATYIRTEIVKWAKVIKASGARPE
ncbi:MAG: tripartite tricarboxylate transporter substrate binding protein [Proteobacteria bacterium]|nr:tripartite tricarboxylate transporter substrate binding protein [Burkholderiales bacterium]